MPTLVGQYEPLELFCLWTKVHLIFFAQRGKGCGWWSFFSRCSTCRSVPEIFAIKVESRQSTEIELEFGIWNFGVFSPSQILGGLPSKRYTHFITPTSRYVAWKWFCKDTPIRPEVLVAHILDFKPNFKFSRLKFLRGTPSKFCNVR